MVKDVSCQGVLGTTLRLALSEIQARKESAAEDDATTALHNNDNATIQHDGDNDSNHSTSESCYNERPSKRKNEIVVHQDFVLNVLNAFADAMQQKVAPLTNNYRPVRQPMATITPPQPTVLLQGQVVSYNRLSRKWRIALHGAKFRIRKPLQRFRGRVGSDGERQFAYDSGSPPPPKSNRTGMDNNNINNKQNLKSEILIEDLEVLAYNDVTEE